MLYFEVQNCEEFERLTCTPIFTPNNVAAADCEQHRS